MSRQTEEIFTLPVGPISGSTPFGYYDEDSLFQIDGPKFCNLSARKLGYPVMSIELPSGSMFAAFEEAITEYSYHINQNNAQNNFLDLKGKSTSVDATGKNVSSNFLTYIISLSDQYGAEAGTGGNIQWYTGSIFTTASVQDYDLKTLFEEQVLGGSEIQIKKIYHKRTPASKRYYDPSMGFRQVFESFPANVYGGYNFLMYPIYDDLLKIQQVEFNDEVRKSGYSFRLINNVLRLYPAPDHAFEVHFEYVLKEDKTAQGGVQGGSNTVSDISNVPYNNLTYSHINAIGKRWISNYAHALVQEMLGRVRMKYQSIPSPNGDISLDGAELVSKGQEEQDKLKEQLTTTLEKMDTTAQMTAKRDQSEIINDELSKIPLMIWIR